MYPNLTNTVRPVNVQQTNTKISKVNSMNQNIKLMPNILVVGASSAKESLRNLSQWNVGTGTKQSNGAYRFAIQSRDPTKINVLQINDALTKGFTQSKFGGETALLEVQNPDILNDFQMWLNMISILLQQQMTQVGMELNDESKTMLMNSVFYSTQDGRKLINIATAGPKSSFPPPAIYSRSNSPPYPAIPNNIYSFIVHPFAGTDSKMIAFWKGNFIMYPDYFYVTVDATQQIASVRLKWFLFRALFDPQQIWVEKPMHPIAQLQVENDQDLFGEDLVSA